MFQTGCLTIHERERLADMTIYRLGYPDREVRAGSTSRCSGGSGRTGLARRRTAHSFTGCWREDEVAGMEELFRAFYTSIPHQWHTNNDFADYEGYYASVFYSYFAGLGLDVAVEESTSRGRLDMAVRFDGRVYVFEFKVVEQAGEGAAMAQLEDRGYADKYRSPGVGVRLVGVEFSSETRNVVAFEHAAG